MCQTNYEVVGEASWLQEQPFLLGVEERIVEGDLIVGRNAVVSGSGTRATVKVLGAVYCHGDDLFGCDLSQKSWKQKVIW